MMDKVYVKAIRKIAWGYVICFFDFNLNTINIIPDWWGILLIYSALTSLSKQEKSVKLLEPLALVLFVYEALSWILYIFGVSLDIYIINVVIGIISLYFHFQLMTNIADISRRNGYMKYNDLIWARNMKVILTTLLVVPIDWNNIPIFGMIFIGIAVIIEIYLIYQLFQYAKFEESMT